MQFFPFLALGGAGGAPAAGGAGSLMSMAPFVLIIGIFYFFIIRPQNKKQKETQKMIEGAKKGDKVITIGGIHGTVTSTEDKTVTVKVDENCKLKLNRSAIATVIADKPAVEDKGDKKEAVKKEKKGTAKKEAAKSDSDSIASDKTDSGKIESNEDEKKVEKDDKANA